MKNLITLIFVSLFSICGRSQNENVIIEAVSSIEKDPIIADQSYFHGKFLSLVKENKTSELLGIYHQKGFCRMVKILYINGECQWARETETDSSYLSVLSEIRNGLPKGLKLSPTSTLHESLLSEHVTDRWVYTNRFGQKCEIEVYFVNGLLNNLGYWIYK
jgi:hypothetical protein